MTFTFNMFYSKSMLVRSAWTGPPAPARKLALAGTPTLLYKFYLNQAFLSEATAAAGRCAGSLLPPKM